MEDGYSLAWDEGGEVHAEEEVICGIESEDMIESGPDFQDVCEEVEVQTVESNGDIGQNVMYISNEHVLVMQQHHDGNLINCEIAEEVVGDQWGELVVGSEEHVGDIGEDAATDDIVIPLPTDQDQYSVERPYPCDFCSRRFRKKANLMNHMVAHQTDKPHGCNLCGARYAKKIDLMSHLKVHAYVPEPKEEEDEIPEENDYGKIRKRQKPGFMKKKKMKPNVMTESIGAKGPSGSRSFEYEDDNGQMMESLESEFLPRDSINLAEPRYPINDPRKPFVCQHCGVGFAREKALASHCRIHAGDSPFECRRCGEMFWDPNSMREHMKTKHSNADDDFIDDDDDEFSDDEDNKFGEFFCTTCGLTFHRQDVLKRHQKVHVKEEFVTEMDAGHICNVCGESFPEALDLLAHAEVHARGPENRCMICGETFPDEQSLAVHVQVKHGKDLPPNTCLHCGRTCKDKRTLLNHALEHTREKSFPCPKCQKTFHNKARLKRHMLSHRNKAVTCEVCGDHFPDGRSLMNHRHSHSSVSGRQFPCRECGKTFGSRSSQQIHIRIHTGERPYGCRFCWKAFADGGTLRKHERIHTGEKPYACAICPRAFNQRVVLREHIRSHHSGPDPNYSHSVTPYCCTVCSDMFSTSQDLIVHLIHHCDLNTAMRRQPHVGPRKYKRRRKLKPYELDLLSNNDNDYDEEVQDNNLISEPDVEDRKLGKRKMRKNSTKSSDETYTDNMFNNLSNAIESISTTVAPKPTKPKKKPKEPPVASRPKMIHTQKTKIAVETNDGGKVRHKTKTLITRTQPTELKSSTGERIRPRTKNVSYHILNPEKLPLATFPDDTEQAVNNLLQTEGQELSPELNGFSNDAKNKKINNSLGPGRHIIGPGHIVKFVGSGMLVSKKKIKEEISPEDLEEEIDEEHHHLEETTFEESIEETVEETVEEEMIDNTVIIKQEVVDNPLNEFAELSMQHANNFFKCEMCSETFSDRAQLLVHVPIHI